MFYQPKIDFKPEEVLVYSRKSRTDDPLLSVEEVLAKHEAILDEFAVKYFGATVPEHNKYREVVSGETIADRPKVQEVLRLVESPKYKAVLIVEVQRLSRGDLEDAGRLIKLLRYSNTIVITPQKSYDLRDEYDRDAFERELKRGNEFLEYQKKILNRGRLLSVSQGNYLGTHPPYGYNKTFVMEGKRKCPTLEINEAEAEVVRMIFDMYVNQNMGCPSICYRLDELGIKPPRGDKWSPPAMKDLLENVHYLGKVKWNFRKTVTIVENSEIVETRPKSKVGEYLIYEGRHDPIISEELFKAAEAKRGKNPRVKAKAKVRNPLAGLLFCKCGRAVSLRTYKNPDGSERSAPRLLCDGQKYCRTGSAFYEEVIDRVRNILKECIRDFEVRINQNDGDSLKFHENLIKRLKAQRDELDKKEIHQWELLSEKKMPQEIFDRLNEKVLKEKEEIQQALCKAYESVPEPVDYEKKRERFANALEALDDPDLDAAEKNRLLKDCIARIIYYREKPQRLTRGGEPKRRKTVNGKRVVVSTLKTGANWSESPIELDVKLRV